MPHPPPSSFFSLAFKKKTPLFLFPPPRKKKRAKSVLERDVDAHLRGLVQVGRVELRAQREAGQRRQLLLVEQRGEPSALGADLGERARGEPLAVADLLFFVLREREEERE